ncbi:MAG: hypothetical protein HY703_01085 [Gemmatimonadetes bacterium]|nr:hypothetical protein [Gemmatimonadota bacterium]
MDADAIRRLLLRQKIATMPELKEVLGTEVDVTVFRKLRELAHRTSYSHRGKYYTLDEIARFDATGLWSFRSVWFSSFGTLIRTCEVLVNEAEVGYFTDELEATLNVAVKDALRKLAAEGRIAREKVSGRFLHVSADRTSRRQQLRARQVRMATPGDLVSFGGGARVLPDELKAAIVLFFAMLDEKQRRLYAGLESLKLGHGGDQRIAELLGLDPGTVARGRRELLSLDVETERVRRKGGGRTRSEKKRPK